MMIMAWILPKALAIVPPYAVIIIRKHEDNRRYGLYGVGNSRKSISTYVGSTNIILLRDSYVRSR